ncbi:MAG: hypothetical protein GY851_30080 [bacterium]|nr:hypothetical protein [bacterium]
MKLAPRDRRVAMIGGIAAAAILVLGYVILPITRTWSEMGDRLGPKIDHMDQLRDRVAKQDSLRTRRDVLIRRMGYLEKPPPVEEEKKDDGGGKPADGPPKPGKPEPTKAPESEDKGAPDAKPPKEGTPDEPGSPSPEKPGPGEEAPKPDGTPVGPKPPESEAEGAHGDKPDGPKPPTSEAKGGPGDGAPPKGGASPEKPGTPPKPEKGDAPKKEEKPPEPAGVSVATHVQQAAGKAGVKITRITPRHRSVGGKKGKHFRPVAMQVSLEGNIKNVIALLHALEKGERFVRVEQFQLRRDIKKEDKVDATLDVLAYEAIEKGGLS